MSRHEIHVFIHLDTTQNTTNVTVIPTSDHTEIQGVPQQKRPPTIEQRPQIDREIARAESFWTRSLSKLFIEGFNIWSHAKGAHEDSKTGSNSSDGLIMEEGYYDTEMTKQFKAAHAIHVKKEKLTDVIVRKGLHYARKKGIEEEDMCIYIESRIGLYAKAIGLTDDKTAQLKSRIYQRDMQMAS